MIKTQTMSENGEIYTAGKIYTAAGSDRRDKSPLCQNRPVLTQYRQVPTSPTPTKYHQATTRTGSTDQIQSSTSQYCPLLNAYRLAPSTNQYRPTLPQYNKVISRTGLN